MWLLIAGIVVLVLWLADVGPFGHLHWVWVALPFVAAAIWWQIADATGHTRRVATRKHEEKVAARRERDMEALGLDARRRKKVRVLRDRARQQDAQAEAARPAPPPAAKPEVRASDEPQRRDPRL